MKRIFFAALIFFSLDIFSQGNNLQFNQVRIIDIQGYAPSDSVMIFTQSLVVDIGKALKIEWAGATYKDDSDNIWYGNGMKNLCEILIDDYLLAPPINYVNANARELPLWLSSGSYTIALLIQGTTSYGRTAKGRISAIEFNIVP